MQAIEMEAQVTEKKEIFLKLPDDIRQGTVKVIIMYDEEKNEKYPEGKPRQFGQFKESFLIAEDFDNELPDAFWLGDEA